MPATASEASEASGAGEAADQRVIVQLRGSASLSEVTAEEIDEGGTVEDRYRRVFKGFSATLSAERVAALEADPDVRRVEPDAALQALETQVAPPWGLDRTDQRLGPLSATYSYTDTGAGVTAFVVDTGVRASHADFGGRVVGGIDLVDNDSDPSDCNGHGTHVAGTIAGATYGVAKAATIVPIRVLNCAGAGYVSDALAAFEWAITHRTGPAVLNFSAGPDAPIPLLDAGASSVIAAGITFVAAAGNEADDACDSSPGRTPAVLTVGATDADDEAAWFSDGGDCIDLFAPGVGVTSAGHTSDTGVATMSGTSMSTPHVAGAVARYLQGNPSATPAAVATFINGTATPDAVTYAYATNNRLLHVDPAGTAPVPAPAAPAPVAEVEPAPAAAVPPPTAPAPTVIEVPATPPPPAAPAGTWSGTGDAVVRTTVTATRTGRLRITHPGSGRLSVWALGPRGGKAQLLVRTTGAYAGTVAYLAGVRGHRRVTGFAVEAHGPWALSRRSLASSPVLRRTASGSSDRVMRLPATTRQLTASHPGRSRFVLSTLSRSGAVAKPPVAGISWRSGTTVVARTARYVLIRADGPWTLRRR